MRVLIITKRQYMSHDLLDDKFGRLREIPLVLERRGIRCVAHASVTEITRKAKLQTSITVGIGWVIEDESHHKVGCAQKLLRTTI